MLGKGIANSTDHRFWLANIQDPFIIGLVLLTKREALGDVPRSGNGSQVLQSDDSLESLDLQQLRHDESQDPILIRPGWRRDDKHWQKFQH
ncbi:unnamed protein product [Arctogadus glacialis]